VNAEHEVDLDRAHHLMMAVLDGEATAADRAEMEALVGRRPDLQAEWIRLQRVKEVTMTLGVAKPPDEFWDQYRRSVMHRTERGVAWALIAVGAAILAASAAWRWIEAWFATDVPVVIQVASGAIFVGGALLIVSVLRERWVLSRRDPYSKEVIR
jgi:anti-sigma factor RsiW